MTPAARLFKRLRAARLDNALDTEMRRLAGVELLFIDDLALQAMIRSRPPTPTSSASNATARRPPS
jgi:DNA replication protein DnaC